MNIPHNAVIGIVTATSKIPPIEKAITDTVEIITMIYEDSLSGKNSDPPRKIATKKTLPIFAAQSIRFAAQGAHDHQIPHTNVRTSCR